MKNLNFFDVLCAVMLYFVSYGLVIGGVICEALFLSNLAFEKLLTDVQIAFIGITGLFFIASGVYLIYGTSRGDALHVEDD